MIGSSKWFSALAGAGLLVAGGGALLAKVVGGASTRVRQAASSPNDEMLSPTMAPLGFLVGDWEATGGRVVNVASSRGHFSFEPVIEGKALLRRDHNDFVMIKGRDPSYDQIMLIYPEDGLIRGDWFDGTHVIHYKAVSIKPGRSVRFESLPRKGTPSYRLTYVMGSDGVNVSFERSDAGSRSFKPIAVGTAARSE